MIKHYPINEAGNDYVVGDIHGNFSQLMKKLEEVNFDKSVDRLFSVGDLVDRGPESHLVAVFLQKNIDWFFPTMGNHDMNIVNRQLYYPDGSLWFSGLLPQEQQTIIDELSCLPIAIEVETKHGKVAIIHGDCPLSNWDDFKQALSEPLGHRWIFPALSTRDRYFRRNQSGVSGITMLYVGHTQVQFITALGNVCYVDTDLGYDGQRLTLTKIN